MIKVFSVENFKGFEEKIVFNLSNVHDYRFNSEAIDNGINKKSLIFGRNGSGKTNLGKAIMDVSRHLTDNLMSVDNGPYKNLNRLKDPVSFYYLFQFDKEKIEYKYKKESPIKLLEEELLFEGKRVLYCNYTDRKIELSIKGSEELDNSLFNYEMSLCKFVFTRAGYIKGDSFYKFYDFVNRMLSFRSLRYNEFEGYQTRGKSFADILTEHGKEESLRELEKFLKNEGLDYKLDITTDMSTNNQSEIFAEFGDVKVPLPQIWSTGTSSLVLFFCWLLEISKTSFLYLDEFDAFYHYELSEHILKLVNIGNYQSIVTTHNCSLMNNKLTRPDCCFIICNNKAVKNLTECTNREIREAHNLENLYKNGAFCD